MKKFLTFAAVLMLAACSSDEIFVDEAPNASSKGQVPIAVNTYLQGQTRTVGYTYYDELPGNNGFESSLTSNGFLLLAKYTKMTTEDDPTPDGIPQDIEFLNRKLTYVASQGWTLTGTDGKPIFWPGKRNGTYPEVTFGAITSFIADDNGGKLEDQYSSQENPTKVLPSDGKIAIPTTPKYDNDKDGLYYPDIVAAHIKADPDTDNGNVSLNFSHILSQVSFTAEFPADSKTARYGWSYKITKITLTGNTTNQYDILTGSWSAFDAEKDIPINYVVDLTDASYKGMLVNDRTDDNGATHYSDIGKPVSIGDGDEYHLLVVPGNYQLKLKYAIRHCLNGEEYYWDDDKGNVQYESDSYETTTTTPITLVAGKKNIINIKLPDTDKMDMGISVGLSDWVDGGNQEPVF